MTLIGAIGMYESKKMEVAADVYIGSKSHDILKRASRKEKTKTRFMQYGNGDLAAIGLSWVSDSQPVDEFALQKLIDADYVKYINSQVIITGRGFKILEKIHNPR